MEGIYLVYFIGKYEKTFRDRGSGFALIFDSECVNGAVRLFSERCVNQKSVSGIGCGGRI